MRKKQISIEVSDELFHKLVTVSKKLERPYAQVIREAVKEKIEPIYNTFPTDKKGAKK